MTNEITPSRETIETILRENSPKDAVTVICEDLERETGIDFYVLQDTLMGFSKLDEESEADRLAAFCAFVLTHRK